VSDTIYSQICQYTAFLETVKIIWLPKKMLIDIQAFEKESLQEFSHFSV